MFRMTQKTTSSWLGAGNYKAPKEAPKEASSKTPSTTGSESPSWGPSHSLDSEDQREISRELERLKQTSDSKNNTSHQTDSTKSSNSPTSNHEEEQQSRSTSSWTRHLFGCQEDTTNSMAVEGQGQTPFVSRNRRLMDVFVDEVCSYAPESSCMGCSTNTTRRQGGEDALEEAFSAATPAERRRFKSKKRLQKITALGSGGKGKVPMDDLVVTEPYEVSRGISELTMRSSYAQVTAKTPAERRMAYYAVGDHHRQSGRGGNRRCYFTGNLILGGNPFYAGSVQQGLRSLVVFLLPSALGLPKEAPPENKHTKKQKRILFSSASQKSRSLTSTDEMSLSIEEELDVNYGIDLDYLLSVLPEASDDLLEEMQSRYPTQYETLPQQVRLSSCWRLYTQFCFFSGLPIAEGESYYKVHKEIAQEFGDDIVLSHEVMETVNGASADILRLPNQKIFAYLKKHYAQQSEKLPEAVFERSAWELVLPEV
jgi:hypothetical protein